MSGSTLRCGVYKPPEEMLPYIAVVITPQGRKIIEAFWSEQAALDFVENYKGNFLEQLSVVGKGVRDGFKSDT